MKKSWRILGSVLLVTLVAWRIDWLRLGDAFVRLDPRWCALAVLLYVVAQLISSWRWQVLARPLGFQVSYFHYVSLYFVGMFFNLLLPTSVGGDVVRGWYLAGQKATRATRRAAFLTVLTERGSGLAMLVLLACVAGIASPLALPRWMAAILLVLGGGFVVGISCLPWLHLIQRLPLVGRKLLPLVQAAWIYANRPGLLGLAVLLSILVQLSSVLQVWLISLGLGLQVPVTYLAVVVPLVSLLTLLPISVNGMGLRELGLVVLLSPVDVLPESAVALSLTQFAVMVLTSLAGIGFYVLGAYPRFQSAPSNTQEVPGDANSFRGGADQGREGQSAAAA